MFSKTDLKQEEYQAKQDKADACSKVFLKWQLKNYIDQDESSIYDRISINDSPYHISFNYRAPRDSPHSGTSTVVSKIQATYDFEYELDKALKLMRYFQKNKRITVEKPDMKS